ncbi:Holliday junction resolvase RuvX [Candidatus Tisiphia endosymbiont of Beris chalybata]|uniref:Holliday junction resolvase RuvX n=1 Tax=Candidatus Tisiphia endosymbiont of Beris chalybata TaxID=3066262 RepID=UPI00312C8E14
MITKTLLEFKALLQINKPIIAIDYGMRKTGLALSDPGKIIAMPFNTIYQIDKKEKIKAILNLATSCLACGIVIGLPINMDGTISEQTTILLKFTDTLNLATELPIYLQDERLSSKAANSLLKSLGFNRRERNNKDDAIAASMLLETTLNSMQKLLY